MGSEFKCASCLDDVACSDDAPGDVASINWDHRHSDRSYYDDDFWVTIGDDEHDDDDIEPDDLYDGEPNDEPEMPISGQDARANAAVVWEWIIALNRMQMENPPQSHAHAVEELRQSLARESQERRERSAGTREGFGPFGPSTFPGKADVTARDDGEAANDAGVHELLAVLES
jgi:hypothetical protein